MFDVALPKWPACLINGNSVTKEQAVEILLRTDYNLPNFSFASNDHAANHAYSKIFGIDSNADIDYDELDRLKYKLGVLEIEFLANERILSSYIGGPNGWVDWEGKVSYFKNIGKWPTTRQVYCEWQNIAKHFPYLNLTCQLFDKEYCEEDIIPLVQFNVQNGFVEMTKPDKELIKEDVLEIDFSIDRNEIGIKYRDFVACTKRVFGDFNV